MKIHAILLLLLLISANAEAVTSPAENSLLGKAYQAMAHHSLQSIEIEYHQKQPVKQFQHLYGYKIILQRLPDGSIGYQIAIRESIRNR